MYLTPCTGYRAAMGSKGICTFYITNFISVFVREGYNVLCYRLATIFDLVQNQRTIIRQ